LVSLNAPGLFQLAYGFHYGDAADTKFFNQEAF
jgi:hypothetical protein